MRFHRILLLLCSTLLWVSAPRLAGAADNGASTYEEICTQCHTPKRNPLDAKHLTREQWNEAIERMKGYGADVPKGKLAELLDHLVGTRGPAGTASDTGKK